MCESLYDCCAVQVWEASWRRQRTDIAATIWPPVFDTLHHCTVWISMWRRTRRNPATYTDIRRLNWFCKHDPPCIMFSKFFALGDSFFQSIYCWVLLPGRQIWVLNSCRNMVRFSTHVSVTKIHLFLFSIERGEGQEAELVDRAVTSWSCLETGSTRIFENCRI